MKKRILAGSLLALLVLAGTAALAQVAEDIQKYPDCKYCGMDRQKFAHSRMLIEYSDGSGLGSCSIHCAAVDLAQNIDKDSEIDQGGGLSEQESDRRRKGVLGNRREQARGHDQQGEVGLCRPESRRVVHQGEWGKLASFDDAMKATYEDMYADTKMIREKRAKRKMMQQGQKP